jgi:hypothetical protein
MMVVNDTIINSILDNSAIVNSALIDYTVDNNIIVNYTANCETYHNDLIKRSQLLNWVVLLLAISYTAQYYKFTRSVKFGITATSIIANYMYLLTGNIPLLIGYYIYDLFIHIINFNPLFILHHLITLSAISICPEDPDYNRIHLALWYLKIGDIFIHYKKLISYTPWYKSHPKQSRELMLISLLLSYVLYIIYRVILPIKIYPFHSFTNLMIGLLIHLANILWVCVIYQSTIKIANQLNRYTRFRYRFRY